MNFLLDQIFAQLIPIILTALSAILTTVLVRGSGLIQERWGIEIEARHREALHSALMSGVRAALEQGDDPNSAITSAIAHAVRSVPDAITALEPSPDVLSSIAKAKLREVVGFTAEMVGADSLDPRG
jgi:hypothetical protein